MPFQKGQSGNLKGCPPGLLLLSPILRRKLKEAEAEGGRANVEIVLDNYIKELKKGKPSDVQALMDRTDGKPKSGEGELGTEENPIHTVHKVLWD